MKYISKAFPADTIPDSDVVFVTYVDVPSDTLTWIEEQIRKEAYFEHIVFQQASAAISSNCGPGTFGILYFLKSNKSYNIASYISEITAGPVSEDHIPEEEDVDEAAVSYDDDVAVYDESDVYAAPDGSTDKKMWYETIECIDTEAALKNSGSEEAFKTVLKIFYDSIKVNHAELEEFYSSEDWNNYTIKIHALKSSARLVGALELGENAQLLETAGKENDIEYIRQHHSDVMKDYIKLGDDLASLYEDEDSDADKPVADDTLIVDMYEGLRMAAEAMDCDMLEDILKEIREYKIPDKEKEKFDQVRKLADELDYDGIKRILG